MDTRYIRKIDEKKSMKVSVFIAEVCWIIKEKVPFLHFRRNGTEGWD